MEVTGETMSDVILHVVGRGQTPTLGKLALALSKAQGMIKGAAKDSANPFFKSKYADLASVWEACRFALSVNEIAVVQRPRTTHEGVEVETMLIHSSDEWIYETLGLPVAKADAQGIGSAITYARRYALTAMVGVAPEDDDGNAAAAGMGKLREKALDSLSKAAKKGAEALKVCWEGLTPDARRACALDLPKLKEESNAITTA